MRKREPWPPAVVHVTELAKMALSPAHFRAAYTDPKESTPAMRLGTAAHAALLGGASVGIFDGDTRRGKAWETFEAANANKDVIITAPELVRVQRMVQAVRDNATAAPFLQGRTEVDLLWPAYGIDCGGRFDVIGDDFLADLKTCGLAEPGVFSRRGFWMHLHAKMSWYLRGAKENKMPRERAILIAVETEPPYAVTTFQLTARALEQGDKTIRRWVEKYQNCKASNSWPAYSQAIVDFDVPEDALELTYGGEGAEVPF